MHPVNKALKPLGIELKRVFRAENPPKDFQQTYERELAKLKKDSSGFNVMFRLFP